MNKCTKNHCNNEAEYPFEDEWLCHEHYEQAVDDELEEIVVESEHGDYDNRE